MEELSPQILKPKVLPPAKSWITDYDIHLLAEGTHYRSFEKLGAHLVTKNGVQGVQFALWAPNAQHVAVVGDFNQWNDRADLLECQNDAGIWEGFIPNLTAGTVYKYVIESRNRGYRELKADPFAFQYEVPPRSASMVCDLSAYQWNDQQWMSSRGERHRLDRPISIYEVHLGSWMRSPDHPDRYLDYTTLAQRLVEYVTEMGFTHIELMPVTEHPYDGSWGYQSIGYYAPTSRFGSPVDFMNFVDLLHQAGIGVIMDWVPAHFPSDAHGLAYFDGTHLYEHADPREGLHQDWGTLIFNFGRNEVANFLISSALFWLEKYHIDGLRVDAVASMLYRDYSRKDGEWIPNEYGGRENIEAINFLRSFNSVVYSEFPDTMTFAEESTAWPQVSRPTYVGGLGFGLKWNMGWMNDMLAFISKEAVHRKYHQNDLTFSLLYAFHENFILPFSHDEVVHGKGSMLRKMPGDDWQKFANLRLLYGYMYGHPGKKLLFMGCEFGQWDEWVHSRSLDWHLLEFAPHQGLKLWVRDLNMALREHPSLYEVDFEPSGFQWIDCHDHEHSILSFIRSSRDGNKQMLCVYNFTPVPRHNYRIGVPAAGYWREVLNSDASVYGGSGIGNGGGSEAERIEAHGREFSLNLTLPPLGAVLFEIN